MTCLDKIEKIMEEELNEYSFITAKVVPAIFKKEDSVEVTLVNTLNKNRKTFQSTDKGFRKTLKDKINEVLG